MARSGAARKRARKRLVAKRKNVVFARPQATSSAGPKVTPLRRMLYIVAAIVEMLFGFLFFVAAIVEMLFRFLSPLLTILQVILEILDKFNL